MRYFGTDGIRGKAAWLEENYLAYKLGLVLGEKGGRVVIARDVRLSSPRLEEQLIKGLLCKEKTEIFVAGILPTPALAYFAKIYRADYAVMITASHNAPEYNGLKLFGKNGKKLSPDTETVFDDEIFRLSESNKEIAQSNINYDIHSNTLDSADISCASSSDIKKIKIFTNAGNYVSNYMEKEQSASFDGIRILSVGNICDAACDDAFEDCAACGFRQRVTSIQGADILYKAEIIKKFPRFDNMKVRLDLANGCFAELAADVFSALGATVETENNVRDGSKVNVKCGSTNIADFAKRVRRDETGFAFDGDGDRVLAVVDGQIYDGDAILLAISLLYRLNGKLKNRFVVGTVLTNTRLQRELAYHGSALLRTDVGDKFVLDAMTAENCSLGGEKSGHIIMLDKAETGDGLLTALTLLEAKKTMGSLPRFSPYPMLEFNIPSRSPKTEIASFEFKNKIEAANAVIEGKGRLIIRPSGTEPYIRVAAEIFTPQADEVFKEIRECFKQ